MPEMIKRGQTLPNESATLLFHGLLQCDLSHQLRDGDPLVVGGAGAPHPGHPVIDGRERVRVLRQLRLGVTEGERGRCVNVARYNFTLSN